MLNELITWVLNTYLGKYLEDFNPAQLSVALLSGEVELENVPIRKDALRSFGIPVQAISGSIGKIKLQIPVRQFRTAPWCIIIERVYAVFGPKNLDEWDDEKEKLAEYEYKISDLDTIEAKWRVERGYQADSYYSTSYASWLNYGTSLATNILENLELKINDVHFRYEDSITIPNISFAAGIKINSLTVQTCDSAWIPRNKFNIEGDISYKLIELNALSIYMDKLDENNVCSNLLSKDLHMMQTLNNGSHSYILHPTSVRAQFKRERCKQAIKSKSRPRIYCELLIPAIKINISDVQYKQTAECLFGLGLISITRSYKLMRPACTISENVSLWWKYAAKCCGFEYRSEEQKWQTLKENLRYMRIYKQLLLNPNENLSDETKEFKLHMEKTRALHELTTLRNVCYANIVAKSLNLKAHPINQGKNMLFHWFPNWWGWYKNDEATHQAQDETYSKIENDILNALEDTMENNTFSKRDVVLGHFTFVLVDGQMLIESIDPARPASVVKMEMEFQSLKCFIEVKPRFSSYLIGVSLGSVCLKDKLTTNTQFLYIIKPQESNTKWTSSPNTISSHKESTDTQQQCVDQEPWFQFQYEKAPHDIQSDIKLTIKSRSLDIVYNKIFFDWFISFFAKPFNELKLRNKNVKKNKKKLKFLQNWKALLMGSESKEFRKNWTLEMDVSAPRIILVDNFVDKNTSVVIADFGRFQMLKNESPRKESYSMPEFPLANEDDDTLRKESEDDDFMTPCSTPPGSKISTAESPTLCNDVFTLGCAVNNDTGLESAFHRKIYDKYLINLTDLQVLISKNHDGCNRSFKNAYNLHLLEKFSISLQLERRVIYTTDPDYPSLTLYGTLSKIVAHVSEEKLDELFKIILPLTCRDEPDTRVKSSTLEVKEEKDVFNLQQNFLNTNLMIVQFVIGQMSLELQSSEKSIAELQVIGVKTGLTKRLNDAHISMSVHGLLLADAIQSFGPDFELLMASHRHVGMDSISGSLRQSEPSSPTSPSSPNQLAERTLSPTVICKLAETEIGHKYSGLDFDDAYALITFDLNIIGLTEKEDAVRVANITFNNLDIIANQETIVELLEFSKRLYRSHKSKFKTLSTQSEEDIKRSLAPKKNLAEPIRTEICFDFHRLNILVLRSITKNRNIIGRKVGTLTLSEAKINANIGKDVCVMGSLGGVQIIDITPEAKNHQRIFSVGKDPLTDSSRSDQTTVFCSLSADVYNNSKDIKLEQENALSFHIYREKNSITSIKVRLASMWYIHSPRFIQEINLCVSQFKHLLKNFAKSIRDKATDMAMEMVQHLKNMGEFVAENKKMDRILIDVILNTPVIILPRSDESPDVLVANLGEIAVYNNKYCEETNSTDLKETDANMWAKEVYHINIQNINLFSLNTSTRREQWSLTLPKVHEYYSCSSDAVPILHDTAVQFKFTRFLEETDNRPQLLKNVFSVEGSVTQCLQLSLSRKQYEQVMDSLLNAAIHSIDEHTNESNCSGLNVDVNNSYALQNALETVFLFKVPIFQIHLKNKENSSLIDITFREFSLQYNQKNDDVFIEVLLRSVIMEDLKCPLNSKLRNMVDSSSDCSEYLRKHNRFPSCPNLTSLYGKSLKLSKSMPSKLNAFTNAVNANVGNTYKTSEEKLVMYTSHIKKVASEANVLSETKSSIIFNCLNLTISVDRWFAVFDFFGLISNCDETSIHTSKNKVVTENKSSTSELKVSVRSLNLILVRNEVELSKANISHASFNILKSGIVQSVEGRLKSVSLYDLSEFGVLYNEKFSTTGPQALSFSYKRLDSEINVRNAPLEENIKLFIQMSSVRYVHTKRFLTEIHCFLKELLQLQSPVIRTIKMQEGNRSLNEEKNRLGLEIKAESPIILFPVDYNSSYVLIADLGKFTLTNSFSFANEEFTSDESEPQKENEVMEIMVIDLANINVMAGERVIRTSYCHDYNLKECFNIGNFTIKKLGSNLFRETCYLKLNVERYIDTNLNENRPDFSIKGTLSQLNGIVNLQQYKLIRGLFTYNLGEPMDDVYDNYKFNRCESIEKLNIIYTEYEHREAKDKTIWKNMSISLQLDNVSVLLVEEQNYNTETQPLACINFIKSTLDIDSYSDGAQDIDLISREILVLDARPITSSNNIFKHILKPSRKNCSTDLVQAEVHSRKRPGATKYTILLNNMRVMAILDCLESIKNFLMEKPNLLSTITPPWRNKVLTYKSQNSKVESDDSFELVLNIADSEIVFVENTNIMDTNAIILKNTTVFKYKETPCALPISIDINHLEVFSCILGSEEESALSIIDPFTLNMELKTNCFQIILNKQLSIRVSYKDIKLFTKMLQSIPHQNKASNKYLHSTYSDFEIIAPLIAMGFNQKDCWTAMEVNNFNLNDSAIWLSQRKQIKPSRSTLEIQSIYLMANFISICIIDDCMDSDVPLLELSLTNLNVSHKFGNEVILNEESKSISKEGHLETVFASDYYNRRLSGWEPIIEPWECVINWKSYASDSIKKNIISTIITSKQLLKMNITSTLVELCEIVQNNWIKDYYNTESRNNNRSNQNTSTNVRRRSPFVPFALENLTGEPLLFKTLYSLPGGITRTEINQKDMMSDWIAVEHNQVLPFDFGTQTKLRHLNSHKLNLHQILIQIQGWTLVGPITIDKVGTFFRYSTRDNQYNKRSRIVFDISLFGSAQKIITVRSALSIMNKLDYKVLLKMEIPHEDKISFFTIEPREYLRVPLRLVDSLIYFKPCLNDKELEQLTGMTLSDKSALIDKDIVTFPSKPENDDVCFSTTGISWLSCPKDSSEEFISCLIKNNTPFYALVQIKRNKYPNRDIHVPGHIIYLLPPLRIKNLLCCDLIFKISGHNQGVISSSQTLNIHTVSNLCESFSLSITLENYKLSGQLKIPMDHTGVVEPKLKLLDVLNRELYLRVSIQSFEGMGMKIFISAPIWIINKTGLPLVYRQEGTNQIGSGQFEEHERARIVSPLLFSFSDQAPPSIEIRLGTSYGNTNPWCQSFNVHKETCYRELKAERFKGIYAIGIDIKRGRGLYSCTTFVILSPRFQLYNNTTRKLEFAQKCDVLKRIEPSADNQIITAPPGCNFPFHWPNSEQEPLLCVRISDIDFCHWSHGIPMSEVHSIYINVRNDFGDMYFLRLEVISKRAMYCLVFTEAKTLPPPIRIDNYSEVTIYFYQYGCKPHWRSYVRPKSSLAYALDDPMGSQILQIEAPGGNTIEFPLNKMEASRNLTYANFIYIALKETFCSEDELSTIGVEGQQLVLGVKDKKVVLTRKCAGDRSQLWLMNSNGQLEHEGSSPPFELGRAANTSATRMVLDLEKAPNPNEFTKLVIRPPNKQRATTQTWRFENNRLMCHANMCIQICNGLFGLKPGSHVVLGRLNSTPDQKCRKSIPVDQFIEIQKLRPGSGHLEINSKMDGPIRTIQIQDVKLSPDEVILTPDPEWCHASINSRMLMEESHYNEYHLSFELQKGLGVSCVTRKPCEELAFITLEEIYIELLSTPFVKSCHISIKDLQIDNQLLDTSYPVLLHTVKRSENELPRSAVELKVKMLPSPNENAVIFEHLSFIIKPCVVCLEERLILKIAYSFGYGKRLENKSNMETGNILKENEENLLPMNAKRFYFGTLYIGPSQIRLSVFTASKLSPELQEAKKVLSLTLIRFEDALIEFQKFSDKHHFEPLYIYLRAIKLHYINEIKWQAASILGSVDFLGNPLGFANDLSEGVSGLIFEGSLTSLVKNVTHGFSNSAAKLTETLSDSLGKVVLDEHDNETRQKILEIQSNTSGNHIVAGVKGLGFGLLGGVTSIVRHTYVGAQADGFPGFLSGLGRGIVGTVTKPIIGVLDLAAETANAVRETSKGSSRNLPQRKRLPRCVTGAAGDLLPLYSYRQSKGQQYLYIINRRSFSEKLIYYEPNLCNDKEAKLRLLVTNEFIRIFSRCEEDPTIMFECHLSEVLSCHPLITNTGNSTNKNTPNFYIEISTNLPKITRPRVKCQNEEIAERAARCINYAKNVFDESEQSIKYE